ncbi:MAG: SusD/RagB family nutrient-binding outer membrane lipoprotein [Marinilabiliales bacterium]|nr:SusD/RagB family nutrient-binding outer membrane lipoprotein [Marinilabiliales bacterium]
MKTLKIKIIIALAMLFPAVSCMDLTELNQSPNSPVTVSSNYILTYVLTGCARSYNSYGDVASNVSGAMQYNQNGTNQGAGEVNQLAWLSSSWSSQYDYLRNIKIIHDNAIKDNNKFFEAISLILKSFNYGLLTDLFGDVPYSEALEATEGVYFSKYDDQKLVYKGILEDLKAASTILADASIANYKIDANADVLYKGVSSKWLKFSNSLRMRYAMRLMNKKSEMSALGVDIVKEFNEGAANAFSSTADEAFVSFLGITAANSAPGGILNSANPNYLTKPCKTIVDTLKSLGDPRLQRWAEPVSRKWDPNVTKETTKTVKNIFGDSFSVVYCPITTTGLDTSLYVGLPQNLAVINLLTYNKGNDPNAYPPEKSPYISWMHSRYRANNETYIRMDLMSYSEVEFLMAEAAQTGGFSISDPETHYKNAIQASLKRWGVTDGTGGFTFANYYTNPKVNLNNAANKMERILGQKWIALWLSIESWFDWRRTGYPVLKLGPATQFGAANPIRYIYPVPSQDPKYLVNYNEAVAKLETTSYVPAGQSKDHTYSRMWLLQGTGKPF